MVEVRLPRHGDPVVLSDVRQGACPQCGGRVYLVETLERIESVYREEPVDRWLRRLSGPPPSPAGR
jgi:hypothetical protein